MLSANATRVVPRMSPRTLTHLVLVRHGESELNALNRTRRIFCGQIETPLTPLGRQQAEQAARQLAALDFLRIRRAVCSPLERARQTLDQILAGLPGPILRLLPEGDLAERSHGLFEGRSEEEAFAEFPHYRDDPAYCQFMNHFEQHAPGGESLAMVTRRAWPAALRLLAAGEGDLLLVSHFNPIRCIVGRALGLRTEEILEMHVPNGQPIVLAFNGRFSLRMAPDLRPSGANLSPDAA